MNERLDRFTKLLKEIFELDKSDLDFGIYRVMNLRKTQIEQFLTERLPQMVQETLAPFAQGSKEEIRGKMKQIEREPVVAIAGEWFTAHGRGASLGFIGDPENAWITRKLRAAFAAWIDNGHSDLNDRNTVILRVALTDAVLLAQGVRYELTDHNGEGES